MVPFRSDATYQHTTVASSPDFRADAAQWSGYNTTFPRSIREAELLANGGSAAPQYGGPGSGGSPASPRASTTVFPATIPRDPASHIPGVPDCLTAGSAYLYRLFHERLPDAPPVAPPETPHVDGGIYMAGLTRPSGMVDGRGPPPLPTSVSMFSPVLGYSAYPVAYPMSFRDLVHLTKTIRGSADKDSGPLANTFVLGETIRKQGTSSRALS